MARKIDVSLTTVDRPIIVGAVPNAVTPSVVANDEHLHHRIRTASGLQIEFEDGY